MYLFTGDSPISEFAAAAEPVRSGIELVGKHALREYPYYDGYLLERALQIRAAVDMPMILDQPNRGRLISSFALQSQQH